MDPKSAPDFLKEKDPIQLFERWFAEAKAAEPADANAMALATAGEDGLPNVRIVLMKDFGAGGITFYTNYQSTKGRELLAAKAAAANFHWKSLMRQIRVRGNISTVGDAEADSYFAGRPRISQLGAWASIQSQPLENRAVFEKRLAEFSERFSNANVPRPPHWSGFRLMPRYIEFWQERAFRLHDRLVFLKSGEIWEPRQLYP